MRTLAEVAEFANCLLDLGNGTYPLADTKDLDVIDLPYNIMTENHVITETYVKMQHHSLQPS